MKNLTMEQIANCLGVSKTTVSRAISGKGRISDSTRERVWSYVDSSDYRMNTVAKGLATSKAYNIGLAIPGSDVTSEVYPFHEIIDGIFEIVKALDYSLIITIVKEHDTSEIMHLLDSGKVDGLILFHSLVGNEMIQYLTQTEFPYVVLGAVQNHGVIHIDYNHRMASKELTKIMLRMGLKKIAFIGEKRKDPISLAKLSGFHDAFNELDIDIRTDLMVFDIETSIQIEKCVTDLRDKKVDAIISMTEFICSNVIGQLMFELPDYTKNIVIASLNQVKVNVDKHFPVIFLQFDPKELGRVACKTLFNTMEHKAVQCENLIGYEIRIKN